MKEPIAYCGINCSECGAYQARKTNDDKLREETAKNWSKQYHTELKATDIDCDGCTSKGSIFFAHCYECGIRHCGIEREVENCAHCPDYACEMLDELLKMVPPAAEKLDAIKKSLE